MTRMVDAVLSYYQDLVDFLKPPPAFATDPDAMRIHALRTSSQAFISSIGKAQKFILDEPSIEMMTGLLNELGPNVTEMFRSTPLPFPMLWLEYRAPGQNQGRAALIVETEKGTSVSSFLKVHDLVQPAMLVMTWTGHGAIRYETPHYHQAIAMGTSPPLTTRAGADELHWKAVAKDEEEFSILYLGLAKALSVLLPCHGMLEQRVTLEGAPDRAARRRAQRQGRNLPDILISKITLGKAGYGQREAMRTIDPDQKVPRRTHWVRGHFMRTAAGNVTWRMPHIRGLGQPVEQERHVTAEIETPEP